MPLALTPVAEFTVDQIVAPEDGDDLDAADVLAAEQLLVNRLAVTRTAIEASILWSGDMVVASGGTLTSFSITIGAILMVAAADTTATIRALSKGATTIGVSKVEGAPGTLGATARWWYVYAYLTDLGAVDFAISLTAPDASRRIKGGDFTRVYLGCFRTDAAGSPLPMQKAGGLCLYRASALGSNELRVVSASSATGATAQSLAALVPPHGRLARLALAATGDANEAALSIFYPGDTAAKSVTCYAATGFSNEVHADVPTDASQVVDWNLTGSGSPAAAVRVHGFYE